MNLTRWFRKHLRYMIGGLVIILMVTWGAAGTVQRMIGQAGQAWGTIRGEPVTDVDMQAAMATAKVGAALGLLDLQSLSQAPLMAAPPRAAAAAVALARDVGSFVFEESGELDTRAAWRMAVLLHEVEAARVDATQVEEMELLALSPWVAGPEGVSRERLGYFLARFGLTEAEVSAGLTALARVGKLVALRREAVRASSAELWMVYAQGSERRRIRFVEVDSSLFRPLVEVSDEELRQFYEQHKEESPVSGGPGYLAPERVRLEYAVPRIAELTSQAQVTDDEVAAYYEEHKAEFALPDEDDREAEAEPEGEAEADPQTAPEPSYRPLPEVSDQIRQELARQKAQAQGDEVVRAVMAELDATAERYTNEPLPLGQMARRHGLAHEVARTPGGSELLSGPALTVGVPLGARIAAFAFAKPPSLYYPEVFTSGAQTVICQVLEVREAEPEPFEQVEDAVREDYVRRAALDRAETFARKLQEAAVEGALSAAAETMGGRLQNLLRPAGGGGGADSTAGTALSVRESEFFERGARLVPGMEGPHPALTSEAFRLGADEVGVAVEGPPVLRCYVLQVSDRQPASAEAFAERGPLLSSFYLFGKQDEATRDWLHGLLAGAERIERIRR